jgi:acyl-coenzyme A synthetase/AMP-(fatty) acid ligase
MLRIDDHHYSRDAVEHALDDLASWLDSQSFPITRLAVCTANTFDWFLLVLHCRKRGLALAPIHSETPIAAALEKARKMRCDTLWWLDRSGLQSLPHKADPGSGTLIQMSSGTTGEPKMVERAWQEIDREIVAYNQSLGMDNSVTPVVACSITHSYGLICGVLATLVRGGEPHIITTWNPKYVLRVLLTTAKPLLYSAPAFIYSLVQLLSDGQRIYSVMTSGTSLPTNWFHSIRNKVDLLLQQYGCSEAGCVCMAHNPAAANIIGKPLPHLQLQVDVTAEIEQFPALGELLVQLPERSVRTQDLVYQNAEGEWVFCSRMDDTIIVSGMNVYPAEVEEVLLGLPGLQEVVVFKQIDELAGQRVAAVYRAERSIAPMEMRRWCEQFLPRHQWPSHWWRTSSIPKLGNGKISRRLLAEHRWQAEETA